MIGGMTYIVRVHFSTTSKETFSDKVKRLLRNEVRQLMEQEENIKCYYADAYQEAVSAPIDSLAFITRKYLNDQSKYFAHSMPAQERKWAFHQLSAMLTGGPCGVE